MSRSVISLTVPETQQAQLVRDGFRTLSDLSVCTAPPSLVRPQPPVLNSAWTLVQRQRTHPHFTTGISTLDALLGNSGLPLGAVLEVVADPVGAAAELCLRLSVGVQLNWPSGEDGVSVVYIDTTGSFSQGAAQRVARKVCGGRVVDPATLLDRIHVFRVYTADELVALLDSADEVFGHLDKVGLLVVNSVSWPFHASYPSDFLSRLDMFSDTASTLAGIATRHQAAVVLVSQAKSANGFSGSDFGSAQSVDGAVWSQIAANTLSICQPPHRETGFTVRLTSSSAYPTGEAHIPEI